MGFFDSIFGKKEEIIQLEEVGSWIENNINMSNAKDLLGEISGLKEELSEKLKELENADIEEIKAEPKLKELVKGNKPAYVSAVRFFIERIKIPVKPAAEDIFSFSKSLKEELDALGKRTAKNFHVMTMLIGKEAEGTSKILGALNRCAESLGKEAENLMLASEIKKMSNDIINAKESRKTNSAIRQDIEKAREKIINEKEEKLKQAKEAERHKDYIMLQELRKEKLSLETEKRLTENSIATDFSPIQKAFKKFNNLSHVQIIESYANDSANALLSDTGNDILPMLGEIEVALKSNKLDLGDDKKKIKALEALHKINITYLNNTRSIYKNILREIENNENKIQTNKAEQVIESLKIEAEECENRLLKLEQELFGLKEKDIPSEKAVLESLIKKLTGKEVRIANALD